MKEVKDEFGAPELQEGFEMTIKTERPDSPDDSAEAFDSFEGNDRCSSNSGKFNLVLVTDNAILKHPPKIQQQRR